MPLDLALTRTAVEVLVRIGVPLVLVLWCFWITQPFIVLTLWGVILAVAMHPGYRRIRDGLGGRGSLAAMLVSDLILVLLIGPLGMLTTVLVGNSTDLAGNLTAGQLAVAPPPVGARRPALRRRTSGAGRIAHPRFRVGA